MQRVNTSSSVKQENEKATPVAVSNEKVKMTSRNEIILNLHRKRIHKRNNKTKKANILLISPKIAALKSSSDWNDWVDIRTEQLFEEESRRAKKFSTQQGTKLCVKNYQLLNSYF